MRVLVTGGFGYLGGRISQNLVEQGHKVVLGSRTVQSVPSWLPQAEVTRVIWDDEESLLSKYLYSRFPS